MNFTMEEQERPYIHAFNVPPPFSGLGEAQKGYHRPSGAPNERSNTSVNATGVVRGMLASGTATYGVTGWGGVTALAEATRSGMGKSHLNVSKTSVKIGETTQVVIDFQGVFDEVGFAAVPPISGWNVEVFVYDPAQPFETFAMMEPSFHGTFGTVGQTNMGVRLRNLDAIVDWTINNSTDTLVLGQAYGMVNLTVPRGSFYGPHAIVAQANFAVRDGSGTQMVQSARQLAIVDVVPDSGQSGTALLGDSRVLVTGLVI